MTKPIDPGIKVIMKPSIFNEEQELLKAIIDLHSTNGIELDPMYFKGNFYKQILDPRLKFDINPQSLGVEKADAQHLPIDDGSISCMVLDPPFMFGNHGTQKSYYSSKTHGIFKSFGELEKLYKEILCEAKRVLKKGGVLFFKCQDYTDSKTTMTHCLVWSWATDIGFYAKDLAILHLIKNKVWNSNLQQKHLRKVHSYFWVFVKQ